MARLLALDPGAKRCGVAVSDSNETMAFPRPALTVDDTIVSRIRVLVLEEEIDLVVVGRPLNLNGEVTASTVAADQFFAEVVEQCEVAVVQCDERLTTTQAQRQFSSDGVSVRASRSRIDSAAAVVLLEHFMDVRNRA